jgi:predicted membrane protein
MDTAVVPVFHIPTTTVVLEVVPTVVAGNAVPLQVMVNVDGGVVLGDVVVGVVVLLEQAIAATRSSRSGMCAGRTGRVHCIKVARRRVTSP